MYKPYKKIFENTLLKNGSKHRSEQVIKKIFKKIQKNSSKESGLNILKQNIMKNYGFFTIKQQVFKRKKRKKKIIPTKIFFSSEQARFSHACKSLVSETSKSSKGSPFVGKFVSQIKSDEHSNKLKTELLNTTVREKYTVKYAVKFRW